VRSLKTNQDFYLYHIFGYQQGAGNKKPSRGDRPDWGQSYTILCFHNFSALSIDIPKTCKKY
jgi:hypothetical protein